MKISKANRAKANVVSTVLRQVVSTLCGIVIPRIMIGAFGSVAYGATTSISQFLSFISLLEGGIGRVARGELYDPLAKRDMSKISCVYQAIKRFFRKIGVFFLIYTLIIAVFYHDIADVTVFSKFFSFGLVIAISLSTFATYMGGIANMTLLHADQKQYLTNSIIMGTNVLNTLMVVVLVWMDANILLVKLVSSFVFVMRPMLYYYYVKRDYKLTKDSGNVAVLKQKWTGMGQHIAYFLHTNTDIVLLTLFADLKYVAVYSVYHLVINSIWNIASSFSGGMESAFGEMIAKGKRKELSASYGRYKMMLTLVTLVLFGTTAVLLIPFIKLYVKGITDANYIQPLFGVMLLIAEAMNCLALPCTSLPVSANRLKQTRWGSYLEAAINIIVSIILIQWNPLLGVAIGTLAATMFKCIYYTVYASKNFLNGSVFKTVGKFFLTIALLLAIALTGIKIFTYINVENYFVWCMYGVVVCSAVGLLAIGFCRIAFPVEIYKLLDPLLSKHRRTPQ